MRNVLLLELISRELVSNDNSSERIACVPTNKPQTCQVLDGYARAIADTIPVVLFFIIILSKKSLISKKNLYLPMCWL